MQTCIFNNDYDYHYALVNIHVYVLLFLCCPRSRMHYYRYESAEVSCCYKYLMFSYNIIFWVSSWGWAKNIIIVMRDETSWTLS